MITEKGLDFLKEINGTLFWEKIGDLGTILVNEISEFYVKANLTPAVIDVKYRITDGTLPPGLTLSSDGLIYGSPSGISISTSTVYQFSVSIYDNSSYNEIISSEEFSINVDKTTSTNFTSIILKPLLKLSERTKINSILSDNEIFDPKILYRKNDPNFGVQKELKLILEYATEQTSESEYYEKLNENFSRRRLLLSSINVSKYIKNNSIIYELVYINVIDNLINKDNKSVTDNFVFNNISIFPPSTTNMKEKIKSQFITSDKLLPKFFETENITYKLFIPLCYCLPNKSKLVTKILENKKINFNNIDFDIDRLHINKLSYFIFET